MSSDTIAGFATLFEGRNDAYGVTNGGTVTCQRGSEMPHDLRMEMHLRGECDYGVYPMCLRNTEHDGPTSRGEWQVKWGCVDLDIKAPGKTRYDFEDSREAAMAATDLTDHASYDNLSGWIEKTKSGGYHVWFFATDWVPAEHMRHALLALCDESGVPTTEVNPKQEYLPDHSSLGNFVRLMYPGGLLPTYDGTRGCGQVPVGGFVEVALECRSTPAKFQLVSNRYRKPMAPSPMPFVGEPVEVSPEFLHNLPHFVRFLLRSGMGTSQDRSSWLFRVACVCKEESVATDHAVAVVGLSDALWCEKYSNRPDAQNFYRTIVERAYA